VTAQAAPLRAIAEAVRAEGRQDQPRGGGGRPKGAGSLTIVVWIAHHTDRKERVVTQTLTQLRALVVYARRAPAARPRPSPGRTIVAEGRQEACVVAWKSCVAKCAVF
jgi:hypothetical protein